MPERERLSFWQTRQIGQGHAHLDADPTYARAVVRRISPAATYAIVRYTSLSADSVTAFAIASGITGGLLTAFGTVATNVAAVVLLQLAYLLDVVDGEVARVRGTAGRRGTYLDLIGHVLQNRALYGGATYSLILVTDFSWWAVVIALLGAAFSSAFGEQARSQVTGRSVHSSPHGDRGTASDAAPRSIVGRSYWLYRRLSFIWNYPASMNLFCLALVADVLRFTLDPSAGPLVLPWFAAAFALTLGAKQLGNAYRLLAPSLWSEP